ncbi:MAG: acyltransferase domain-containing protein, partial [Burkholderiaceae bacterium]
MSLGLLFSGQGTQHAAMLPWLEDGSEASTALSLLAGRLGDDWRARLDDPGWSTRNDIAQPLLTGVCLAAWEQLAPMLPAPRVIAGYSVGELAAFSAAGVFDAASAMALAAERARFMDECVRDVHTGLLSVSGAAPMAIERWCAEH